MNAPIHHRIALASRPVGRPGPQNFQLVSGEMPEPGPGEVLTRTIWLSLAPYMFWRMRDEKSYAPPVGIGETMVGATVGQVVTSNHPGLKEGDLVLGQGGWQDYAVLPGANVQKIDPAWGPSSLSLNVLGSNGLTAYAGLLDIGKPKPGETVVVAAASGGVGAIVGQIARIKGARAIGIAGGAEKCAFVRDELGFDACIDHRGALDAQLEAVCPEGIDVYWENVGGAVQAAVFPRLRDFARMVMCGVIAQYNVVEGADSFGGPPGPNLGAVVRKRLRIQGFIVSDTGWPRYAAFRREMLGYIGAGRLRWREDVVPGLHRAPEAFIGLLEGRNFGKLVVAID